MRSLISTRLSVIFCKLCAPSQAHWVKGVHTGACTQADRHIHTVERNSLCPVCVCAYVGRQFSSHCSLMPFTCFNQHQSTLGMRLVILIEKEKYNCWGGGREYSHISEYCFPFTCNIIGLNVVDQSNFADLHTPHADTNHWDSQLLPLIERSHIAEVFANYGN